MSNFDSFICAILSDVCGQDVVEEQIFRHTCMQGCVCMKGSSSMQERESERD